MTIEIIADLVQGAAITSFLPDSDKDQKTHSGEKGYMRFYEYKMFIKRERERETKTA